ncbi:hypothetical protein EMIHUDRAFT_250793 [Emiliania huxleyi CCMP1516]|uniref:Uncharacterized protein n=2 Tax=Emiliania huxleyi TaxID=2903 RepID=A0A0D3HXU1_EMIH1|nr:hypothetical protein EMIHUDRAFT_250793 [Emiliania huxleyi CCMP1516]EOD03826.1 hypothetical protein EMIHUDRAFT_250793 [Emiliania huxleyi CCMP1516]|eukprot:XP_005756255.1 hypothetical protein EMIHUDRAFT_250793 [Emiliania huxleyi CCMP1516]
MLVTKCEGCNNINGPGECSNTCGDAAGLCSKCDGTLGTPGACCQKGEADDPPECSWVPDTSFLYDGYHTVSETDYIALVDNGDSTVTVSVVSSTVDVTFTSALEAATIFVLSPPPPAPPAAPSNG